MHSAITFQFSVANAIAKIVGCNPPFFRLNGAAALSSVMPAVASLPNERAAAPRSRRPARQGPARGGKSEARQAQGLLRRHRRRRQDLRHARGSARSARREGVDVVVGYVEPHGRAETEALLEGLEQPAATASSPTAARRCASSTSTPRSRASPRCCWWTSSRTPIRGRRSRPRHAKRWQDVEELLDAGIDVYTTVNVQHIESLNDVVAGITGVRMQETVPDMRVRDRRRGRAGRHAARRAAASGCRRARSTCRSRRAHAIENFFRKGNLIALRELALRTHRRPRRCGDARVPRRARRSARPGRRASACWWRSARTSEAERLVRAGKRMATALHARWIVVYVETPGPAAPARGRARPAHRAAAPRRIAGRRGGDARRLVGRRGTRQLRAHAQRHPHPDRAAAPAPLWRRLFRPSTYGELLARSRRRRHPRGRRRRRNGRRCAARSSRAAGPTSARSRPERDKPRWPGYAWSVGATARLHRCSAWRHDAGLRAGQSRRWSTCSAVVAGRGALRPRPGGRDFASSCVAAFDFFFVPPQLTFAVSRRAVPGDLRDHARGRADHPQPDRQRAPAGARRRPSRAAHGAALRDEPRTRGDARPGRHGARRGAPRRARSSTARWWCCCPTPTAASRHPRGAELSGSLHGADLGVAQWVFDHGEPAGLGTDTLPGSEALYLPLHGSAGGARRARRAAGEPRRVLLPEQFHLLETFAGQIALALERAQLAEHAQRASIDAETEGCATRCWPRFRTTCARRSRSSPGASSSLAERGERPERRRARGAGAQHLRAVAADERADHQRARHDAPRGRRDRARRATGMRSARSPARCCAGCSEPAGRASGRGRPAGATCRWCASTRR